MQRKTRVWNSSPPPPAGRLPRRNYFGLSSLVQPPQGGRLQPWERDPLPGPWAESPRREGTGKSGQLQHLPRLLGRSGAGWEGLRHPGLENAPAGPPSQPGVCPGSLGEAMGQEGSWASGLRAPGQRPRQETPRHLWRAQHRGPGPCEAASRTPFRDTPWACYSHLALVQCVPGGGAGRAVTWAAWSGWSAGVPQGQISDHYPAS